MHRKGLQSGFWVFEYALWQKAKSKKCQISTETFLNQKSTQCEQLNVTQKTAKKQSVCYLSKMLALITNKLP